MSRRITIGLRTDMDQPSLVRRIQRNVLPVNELEPLLEVNTDKVDTEIPAPASGTVLKILAEEGVPAKVGTVLAFIGKPGESVEGASASSAPIKTESRVERRKSVQESSTLDVQPSTKQDIGFISPVVAKIAAEHGVAGLHSRFVRTRGSFGPSPITMERST